jgi:hypothetical protein
MFNTLFARSPSLRLAAPHVVPHPAVGVEERAGAALVQHDEPRGSGPVTLGQ